MDVKKAAREEIANKLRHELAQIVYERHRNRNSIRELSQRQRILKKKAVELRGLIRGLGCSVQET